MATTPKYGEPQFPVIAAVPSNTILVQNIRFMDWINAGVLTVTSYGLGFVLGKPVRVPSALTAASLGLSCGICLGYQNSFQRFMGLRENAAEVKKFGTLNNRLLPANYEKLSDKMRVENFERFADPYVPVASAPQASGFQ